MSQTHLIPMDPVNLRGEVFALRSGQSRGLLFALVQNLFRTIIRRPGFSTGPLHPLNRNIWLMRLLLSFQKLRASRFVCEC